MVNGFPDVLKVQTALKVTPLSSYVDWFDYHLKADTDLTSELYLRELIFSQRHFVVGVNWIFPTHIVPKENVGLEPSCL